MSNKEYNNNSSSDSGGEGRLFRLVIGVTGASGQLYAQRIIELARQLQAGDALEYADSGRLLDVGVIFTDTARQVYTYETGTTLPDPLIDNSSYFNRNASGSNPADALVVIPCSMGTLAHIRAGTSDDLICRIADVQLKERRTLVLVPRESPYSQIHLSNMLELSRAGAIIAPASPSFYSIKVDDASNALQEMVTHFCYRILSLAGVCSFPFRWME